ncbi:hypothetical protein KVT40_007595 [Elsinoe batatas]|uniref:Uncharacterized protein n=1 Tax=Elsinoe batatas TaxID=2601811 RepID=A0A8K0KXQ3_9PEZI|nr:hypothetical protein KVT40_007595 [Elsinoe batatas]
MPPTKSDPGDGVKVKLESAEDTEVKTEDRNVQARVEEEVIDTKVKTEVDVAAGSGTTNVAPARIPTALRPVERQPGDEERRNGIIEDSRLLIEDMTKPEALERSKNRRTWTLQRELEYQNSLKRRLADQNYNEYCLVRDLGPKGRFWCPEDRKWCGERRLIPWNDKEVEFMLEERRQEEEQKASWLTHVNPKKRKRESQMESIYNDILTVAKSDKQQDQQSKEIAAMLGELHELRSGAVDDE